MLFVRAQAGILLTASSRIKCTKAGYRSAAGLALHCQRHLPSRHSSRHIRSKSQPSTAPQGNHKEEASCGHVQPGTRWWPSD
ncbi:hypothetical protein WJX72_006615 [[Myrmecia] bisecta]|uniref:Secreted protein n=1 Tax=[Myrmecia] bisecta TaxID=41462 RepID=A0AAW1QR72_9CHLO